MKQQLRTTFHILNRLVRGVLLKINKEKTNTDNKTTKTTKLRLFDSVILLIPQYGSETSTIIKCQFFSLAQNIKHETL